MVRDFQRVIGDEARAQVLELTGRLPDAVAACVGGGSNAIGIFTAFVDDPGVRAGTASRPAATASRPAGTRRPSPAGAPGVLHGARSYLLQDDDGPDHRVALDLGRPRLPGRRARARLAARHRPGDVPADHRRAGDGRVRACCAAPRASSRRSSRRTRSPARSSVGRELGPDAIVLVNLSGRGDKDVDTAAKWFGARPSEPRLAS